jgi:hypothetical protein
VEYEVAVAKATKAWDWVKRVWAWCRKAIGFLALVAAVIFLPWFVWKIFTDHATRVAAGQGALRQLKWYLIFATVGWVISKIWRKPKETEHGEEPSVPSGKQKDRRKNKRRVQRGR